MLYEDPEKVGKRLGWDLISMTLPHMFRKIIVPIYENLIKKEEDVKFFQLVYSIESSYSEINPDKLCQYCVACIDNVFCVYELDTTMMIVSSINHCTDIFIKRGPMENYIIEIFIKGIDEEGNLKAANFLFQTLPRYNDKLEKKFGRELGSPNQLISYLRSHPAYKSSL